MKTETVGSGVLETWTVDEVQEAFDQNEVVLIDVRTPQEYMFEHIEGAMLVPMSFFCADKMPGQSEKRIVFHCGSGMRSERVAKLAIEKGGRHRIAHMEGGFGAWKTAKKPHIGTDMSTGAPKKVTY